ncbi:MAG TPA: hypothetical protein VF642_04530 [Propionibacteriaceae bacterium]
MRATPPGGPADPLVVRAGHWPWWLLAGVLFGVGVGFLFGLTRPRVKE